MPRGDATGPMGMGSMTGRQAGYCAGNNVPGHANQSGRRGWKMGFGRKAGPKGRGGGFGFRHRFFSTGIPGRAWLGGLAAAFQKSDPESEKQALQHQADLLQSEMDAIKKRLDELTAGGMR